MKAPVSFTARNTATFYLHFACNVCKLADVAVFILSLGFLSSDFSEDFWNLPHVNKLLDKA